MSKRKIKGILINPEDKTIKEVEFEADLQSYYDLIGCTLIDRVQYDDHHDVVVDDEGLFSEPTKFFKIDNYDGLLAGKGIIVGVGVDPDDPDGGLTWVSHNLDKVRVGFVEFKDNEDNDSEG